MGNWDGLSSLAFLRYYHAHAHSTYAECNVFTISVLPSVHRGGGGGVQVNALFG